MTSNVWLAPLPAHPSTMRRLFTWMNHLSQSRCISAEIQSGIAIQIDQFINRFKLEIFLKSFDSSRKIDSGCHK